VNESKMIISRDNSIIDNEFIAPQRYSWDKKEKWQNENFDYDILLDETFQENYKSFENLSQADTISEDLTQGSSNILLEESSQVSCSYTLIEDSDQESLISIDSQSRASFDNHKQLHDSAIQQVKKNWQFIRNIIEKRHKTKRILTLNL
ncbi:18847_t:CDS:2, partial [Racocetra persica]